jgi:hypothetical protein
MDVSIFSIPEFQNNQPDGIIYIIWNSDPTFFCLFIKILEDSLVSVLETL